jgi:RES domain-containing protein
VAKRLIAEGAAGLIAPSYARRATPDDASLVLWDWSGRLPHRVAVFDPSGRLPKNQLSWP